MSSDCEALAKFGSFCNAAEIMNWTTNISSWCCESAEGVICDQNNHVVSISMPNRGIQGRIYFPPGSLTDLTTLNLQGNMFTGSLEFLSSLTRLTSLNLWNNSMNGPLDALENATLLSLLDMEYNHITGTLQPLRKMENLEKLYLSSNKLHGDIQALSDMTRLVDLYLYENKYVHELTL